MNLLNLIERLRTEPLPGLYHELRLSPDAVEEGRVTVYMVDDLGLQSTIRFFDSEEIDQIRFQQNGVSYVYFLELFIVLDFLEEVPKQYSDTQAIAERLLHYAIYDA